MDCGVILSLSRAVRNSLTEEQPVPPLKIYLKEVLLMSGWFPPPSLGPKVYMLYVISLLML